MNHVKQANRPDWFRSDESKAYFSLTSGSSHSNEWYEFDNRAEALALVVCNPSQQFLDNFVEFDGEFYDYEQFTPESLESAEGAEEYCLKAGAKPATVSRLLEASSDTGFRAQAYLGADGRLRANIPDNSPEKAGEDFGPPPCLGFFWD